MEVGRRRVAKLGDLDVADLVIQHFTGDKGDDDVGARERKLEWLVHARALDGQDYIRARRSHDLGQAHQFPGPCRSRLSIHGNDLVPGLKTGLFSRITGDGGGNGQISSPGIHVRADAVKSTR